MQAQPLINQHLGSLAEDTLVGPYNDLVLNETERKFCVGVVLFRPHILTAKSKNSRSLLGTVLKESTRAIESI
jgi:hypothetical protein